MADFRPLPTPWRYRWREFRMQALPLAVFVAAVVAVVFLWERELAPPVITGEVYGYRGEVGAPRSGTLIDLAVEPFDDVGAGDLIGRLRLRPEEQTAAALEVLRAELALARAGGLDPVLDQERNLLNRQGIRRDWLQARADLASLSVRAREAEVELRRIRQLFERNQVSEAEFDRAKANFDALSAEKEERRALVDELAELAGRFDPGETGADERERMVRITLDWQEKRLRQLELELGPVEMRAPVSGTVTRLHRHAGEFVSAGDPVVDVSARTAEFIVGYLRMPAVIEPREGMVVKVSSRGARRVEGEARVLRVGAGFEALGPAFAHPVALREERALPLMISVPPGLPVRPGEIVDVHFLE